jgi:hypothetical protein
LCQCFAIFFSKWSNTRQQSLPSPHRFKPTMEANHRRFAEMPKPAWYKAIGKYAHSDLSKSLWQLLDTFVPYCVLFCFMFSINLKVCIGRAMNFGTLREWRWRVVLISSCRKSSSGSQATLVCIIFITRDPRFPIIICNGATMTSRHSTQLYR